MDIIRIIPITDENNKSKLSYANFVVNSGKVIYQLKDKKNPITSSSRMCNLKEFLNMGTDVIGKGGEKYLNVFKSEHSELIKKMEEK